MAHPRSTMIAPLCGALVEVATSRGAPPSELLRILGASAEDLALAEKRIAVSRVFDTWQYAMKALRDPTLPVAVGRLASFGRYGLLGYALYTSATLRDAVQCAIRYHDLINDSGRWNVTMAGEVAVVTWKRDAGLSLGERVASEQAVVSFATILRALVGDQGTIHEVILESPRPSLTAAHEEHFRAPVRWGGDRWAIRMPASVLDLRPKTADPLLMSYFVQQTEAALARMTRPDSWSRTIATTVADLLPGGIPTLTEVAKRLGSSERTARRRLRDEQTTFDTIVGEVQRERALLLLEGGGSVRDAAFATGFSDPSAFSRAYRRWTGSAPSTRRASRLPKTRSNAT